MTQEQKVSIPTAILLGCAMIAVGAFLGLRGRGGAADAPTAVTSTTVTSTTASPASTLAAPGATVAPPAAVNRSLVISSIAAELAKHEASLTEKCLKPSLAKQPEPKVVNLTFNFSFDAQGHQIVRGVSEERETSRPEVTRCVSDLLPAISIAATGVPVAVEVPFSLR